MTETTNRCERGPRCHARERLDTPTHGNPDAHVVVGAVTDRPLCDTCTGAVAQALEDVPALYLALRGATLLRDRAEQGEKVRRSSGSPMPLNARALDLGEQLAWLLCAWEDEVRVIAQLAEVDRSGQREGVQVQHAAATLQAHLTAWIAAPTIAFSVDRWSEEMEQSGAEAAAHLLEWRAAVRRLPGLDPRAPKAVRRYTQRCPGCGVRAITHRAGDDLMHCQSCGATQPYMPTLPADADYAEERSA